MSMLTITGLLAFFFGMLACAGIGRRIGLARLARDPEGLEKGAQAAEGSMLALLGLLLAFTFSGAAGRIETRKELIVAEANAIGTAYLRLDMLPADAQPALRDLFRDYVDSRLATYKNVRDDAAVKAGLAASADLQARIWTLGVAACVRPDAAPGSAEVLLPALNEMIDITTTRMMATKNHPPPVIFALLTALCFLSALLVGYGTSVNQKRRWLHTVAFSLTLTMTVYVIVDIEFPRLGLIRVDSWDQVIVDVRKGMD